MILTKPKLEKLPYYLSPSSLWAIENTPCKFYLERLLESPDEREPQGKPAAVGSAFDYFIKIHLAKKMNKLEDLRNTLMKGLYSDEQKLLYQGRSVQDMLWQMNVEPELRAEAAGAGKLLFDEYNKAMSLLSSGLSCWEDRYSDIEIHREYNLRWKGMSIPLFGKGDACTKSLAPLDWKVKGYGSDASPTKGYYNIWKDGAWKGPHKDYCKDITMDFIDKNYASQLCTYGWMLGILPGTTFSAEIEQIIIRGSSVKIALYRGVITRQFQFELAERYAQAWTSLRNGKFLERVPCDIDMLRILANREGWF